MHPPPADLPRGRTVLAAVLAAGLDVCLVLAFVLIGRASHHDAGGFAGFARTAWPFLAGLACGELATRAWRRPGALLPAGVGVWLCTVAVGMALRAATGQGVAIAFVGVTLAFLGLFLLGWRALLRLAYGTRRPPGRCTPGVRAH